MVNGWSSRQIESGTTCSLAHQPNDVAASAQERVADYGAKGA